MAIIGTDASIDVCKEEGYMMMEYDARKRFKRDSSYRLFRYFPLWTDKPDTLILDTYLTFDDLVEKYEEKKEAIDSFAQTNKFVNFENPTEYDFLNLASDVDSYGGLE